MDYRFLSKITIEKFFEETQLSVGEIIEVIALTKTKLESKNKAADITDKMWYETFEVVIEEILSDPIIEDEKEWEETINKVFIK